MKTELNFKVALTKELCPICLKEMDGPLVINSELTKFAADAVEKLHGKVVGFSDDACEECVTKSKTHKLAIILIETPAQKELINFSDVIRTGTIINIRNSDFEKNLKPFILRTKNNIKFCFMDVQAAKTMGLIT